MATRGSAAAEPPRSRRRLLVALAPGQPLWLLGAARVSVLAGSAALLGAVLDAGAPPVDVVAPPFESALAVEPRGGCDLRAAARGSPECALLLRQLGAGAGGAPPLHRTLLALDSVDGLESYLAEYDCSASELAPEWWSAAVPGACVLASPPGVPRPPGGMPGGGGGGGGGGDGQHAAVLLDGAAAHFDAASLLLAAASPRAARRRGGGAAGPAASLASCRVVARPTVLPPSWRAAVHAVLAHASLSTGYGVPRVLPLVCVTGGKGAGKSTFVRFLVNSLLSAVDAQGRDAMHDDDDNVEGVVGGGGASAAAAGVGGGASPAAPAGGSGTPQRRLFARGCIAYLDMDCGQPEHTVPGCVSLSLVSAPLLTPPHARVHASAAVVGAAHAAAALRQRHAADEAAGGVGDSGGCGDTRGSVGGATSAPPPLPRAAPARRLPLLGAATVVDCRFIGSNSPKGDPDGFVRACAALLRAYRAHLAPLGVPCVINTHGWVRGVGLSTIQAMLDDAAPTHVVHLDADGGGGSGGGGGGGGGAQGAAAGGDGGDDGDDDAAVDGGSLAGGDDEGEDGDGAASPPAYAPADAWRPPPLRGAPPAEQFTVPPSAYQPWATLTPVPLPPPPPLHGTRPPQQQSHLDSSHSGGGGGGGGPPPLRTFPSSSSWPGMVAWPLPPTPLAQPLPRASHSVWSSGLGVSVYHLPPWHVAAAQLGVPLDAQQAAAAAASGEAGAAGTAPPPRAARSPVELRAMRVMLYLLSGLRAHAPGEIAARTAAAAAAAAASEEAALREPAVASELLVDGDGEDGCEGEDEAEADAGGDAEARAPLHEEELQPSSDGATAAHDEAEEEGAHPSDALDDEGDDDDERGEACVDHDDGDEDGDGNGDEDGDDDEEADEAEALTPGALGSSNASPPLDASLPLVAQAPAVAMAHYWAILKAAVRSAFWRVLAEGSEARVPVTGLRSPALALSAATACVVPISDVVLATDASQPLHLSPAGEPLALLRLRGGDGDHAQRHLAACAHGQLVGLCSTLLLPPPPLLPGPGGPSAPTTVAVVAPSELPCLGVGYVRAVDVAAGLLELVTPVPLSRLADVDVLVRWAGAPDLPAQLLFRAHPHGVDAFAVASHALAPTSASTARSDHNRKQLKRQRLDGRGGGGGRGGGRGRGGRGGR